LAAKRFRHAFLGIHQHKGPREPKKKSVSEKVPGKRAARKKARFAQGEKCVCRCFQTHFRKRVQPIGRGEVRRWGKKKQARKEKNSPWRGQKRKKTRVSRTNGNKNRVLS